jgi:hypothetical protein
MKILFVVVGAIIAILIYPRYDLLTKKNFFDEGYTVEHEGYITSVGCHKAANEMKARYYACEPKEIWKSLFLSEEAEQGEGKESGLPDQ